MREHRFGPKKAGTSSFSNPSLVSPHTPTLANPVCGFGLPKNNVIQTATQESSSQQQAHSANEQSLLSPNHDFSRIALRRSQEKLTVGEPQDNYEQQADGMANHVMQIVVPDKLHASSLRPVQDSLQRKCAACEEEEEKQLAISSSQQAHPLQRKLDDSHNLTSPRFAGDPILEACFDDQARLTQGAKGISVVKVQQALIDLGYDLGSTGADGDYGIKTWNAVKKFKANQSLGWENMGDVGPGTMGRLDQLFSQVPPDVPEQDFADEEDGQSCPTGEEIVGIMEDRPDITNALFDNSAMALSGTQKTGTQQPGSNHVTISEAVKRFKDKVDVKAPLDSTNISARGQFFWGRQLGQAVKNEIERMAGEPSAVDFVIKARAAHAAVMEGNKNASLLLQELNQIAQKSKSPEKPNMLALLRNNRVSGGALEAVLWAELNKSATNDLPSLAAHRSLRTLQTLRRFDKQSCGFHALQVAERLKKKGGIVALDPKAQGFSASLATGGTRDRRPVPNPTSSLHLGDVVSQSGVGSAVAKMQKALDAGLVVHARVLSGVGYGTEPDVRPNPKQKKPIPLGSPPEEHSLLIIGYEDNKFVFNDPDAAVSHSPEAGFGFLFYDSGNNRLSTAESSADLVINPDGKHSRGDKRYQIITLATT